MAKSCFRAWMIFGAAAILPFDAYAQDVIPPKVYSTTPGGVNVSDGSFVYSTTDLAIGPLTLERFHLAGPKKPNDPYIGKNMSHNFDIYVAPNRKVVSDPYKPVVHIGSSASGVYVQGSTLTSVSANNLDAQKSGILSYSGGNYSYTDRSGNAYSFTSTVPAAGVPWISQRVSQIVFADGRMQTFSYNASKQLKLVTDSSGYAILFDYNAAGDVSVACAFNLAVDYISASSTCTGASLKVSYGYDGNGLLTSVVAVDGQITTYSGGFGSITCVKPPGYASCKVSMDGATTGRVSQQTMADGSVWNIIGGSPDVNDPEGVPAFDGDSSGSVTDPNGKTTYFRFTKTAPYTTTDPNGKVTRYLFQGGVMFDYQGAPYHDGTMLIQAILPEGNAYLAEYNGPFRSITKETMVAKPGSGLANLVKEYGYNLGACTPQNCAKPIWIKDPKGNQTDYSYAPHGATISEMQPAPSAGAARPLKLFTYVQRYAYIKNSGGALVAAAAPIWLLESETLCQTPAGSSVAACDGSAPITVTTYEYGANGTADNLLVRGKVVTSGGVSLRTCYGYDSRSRKIWETSPRGTNSAVCS